MSDETFYVRAPGRVCLFGEHSDYLGLDVITAAIDLSIEIESAPRNDDVIRIEYVDINESDTFTVESTIHYRNKRDYVRSAFNVLKRRGIVPRCGADLKISGDIPLAAGLSSSSALTVATVMVVSRLAGISMTPEEVAISGYDAEVAEFGESGGSMDHFASAVGGIIHVNMSNNQITQLPANLNTIVIGDSEEQKQDTVGDLRYIRTTVEREYESIRGRIESFDRRTTPVNQVYGLRRRRPAKERRMAEATLQNRDLTYRALNLLQTRSPNHEELGEMLREHHELLRDAFNRSTQKIEQLIEAAYDAGALGCKINGSGGGGSMMAYAAENEEEIARAIQEAGGTPYAVKVGNGASFPSAIE